MPVGPVIQRTHSGLRQSAKFCDQNGNIRCTCRLARHCFSYEISPVHHGRDGEAVGGTQCGSFLGFFGITDDGHASFVLVRSRGTRHPVDGPRSGPESCGCGQISSLQAPMRR